MGGTRLPPSPCIVKRFTPVIFSFLMSTTIPPGIYRFSSDHRSQAWSGEVSTWMGDRLGILRVVDFLPYS